VVKSKDRVHKSPIFESVSWPHSAIPYLLPGGDVVHPRSFEQRHGSGLVMWCTRYWSRKTGKSNGRVLICRKTCNGVLISQPGRISTLPGCAQRNMATSPESSHQFHNFSVASCRVFLRLRALQTHWSVTRWDLVETRKTLSLQNVTQFGTLKQSYLHEVLSQNGTFLVP
jgi:hypothetical protein